MGNIKSFCCRDNVSEIDDRQERARILSDNSSLSGSGQDDISYNLDNGTGSILSKADCSIEQSALEKIYQKMVANVIDVAPCESMVIQPDEFIERQKTYQTRLNLIKTPLMLRSKNANSGMPPGAFSGLANTSAVTTLSTASPASPRDNSPQHVSRNQEKRRVEYEPISADEIQLINEIGDATLKAVKSLKVTSQEPVVIRFQPFNS